MHGFKHSIDMLQRWYNHLPPLTPREIKADLWQALDHLKNDADTQREHVHQTLLIFGKKLWPYRRAFDDVLEQVEKRRSDEFFTAHVGQHPELSLWFKELQSTGVSAHEFFMGQHSHVGGLQPEQRAALCEAIVQTKRDIRGAAAVAVAGPEKEKYQKKVIEYQLLIESIDGQLQRLRALADDEQQHPQLAAELRAKIEHFEMGLAHLAPHTDYGDVCDEYERVHGRAAELRW